jgi:glycosyltransferase involved in cell wall biosynthesis
MAFAAYALRVVSSMNARGSQPSIFHAHVFSAGVLAVLLSHGRLPVVISEHHSDFVEGRVHGKDALLAHFAFRNASLVCAVSARLKDSLQAFEPAAHYEVVPNIVDTETFVTVGDRRDPRRADGPTRILVVAMLDRQKGVEYLIRSLAQVHGIRRDFTLDVVGDGPLRRMLESVARSALPPGVVTFHGARSRPEVADFMARADVFVLPSVVETFGVVLIEAIAAGLPIITTRAVPGCDRIDGTFGLVVPPGDPVALRDALLSMLDKASVVSRETAREFARSFSPSTVGERWDQIYRSLARAA